MKNNAIITITNRQSGATGQELIKETYPGLFYSKNGKFYILYEAEQGGAMLSINGGQVILKRSGAYASTMRFETEKTDVFTYKTPYGAMQMELMCNKAEAVLTDAGGAVFLQYKMKFGGEDLQNSLTIDVRKERL